MIYIYASSFNAGVRWQRQESKDQLIKKMKNVIKELTEE